MNDDQKTNRLLGFETKHFLSLAFPPLLLIVFVVGLLVLMVSTCVRFTKGPLSMVALLQQLQQLQAKFLSPETVNPEAEREQMEMLQNKIKTSSEYSIISGNTGLKKLFFSNCQSIQTAMTNSNAEDKIAWIKLNALMVDFNSFYFGK